MLQHHALLTSPCTRHGDHVCHLISSDDTAWTLARTLRDMLREGGLPNTRIATWTGHTDGVPAHEKIHDEEDAGGMPF